MPIRIVTRGRPPEAGAVLLRDKVNNNMNVRRLVEEITDAKRRQAGQVPGLIGGLPPPRGVAARQPSYSDGGTYPWVDMQESSTPASGGSGVSVIAGAEQPVSQSVVKQQPAIDYQAGSGVPISLALEVAIDAVQGVQTVSIPGPLICRGWHLVTQGNETTSAQWNLWRCDFSSFPGLQGFVFNNNGLPTGGGKDGVSLFWTGSIHDQTTLGGQIPCEGWSRLIGPLAPDGSRGFLSSGLIVPYETVYVKFYCQNDSAGARIQNLYLDCQYMTGVALSEIQTRDSIQTTYYDGWGIRRSGRFK